MTAYAESPIGRVVNVAWPGEVDPGLILARAYPWWLWFENDNGVRRIQIFVYNDDWSALSPQPTIDDRMRTLKNGAVLEDHPMLDIDTGPSTTRLWAQTIYLPGVWPVPSEKPDRVEVRQDGTNALLLYANLLESVYDYTYDFRVIDNNWFQEHEFDRIT